MSDSKFQEISWRIFSPESKETGTAQRRIGAGEFFTARTHRVVRNAGVKPGASLVYLRSL
jgi:hypothetical protein